jgi:hypothetical protein
MHDQLGMNSINHERGFSYRIGDLLESALTSSLAFIARGFFYGLGGSLAAWLVYLLHLKVGG